MGVHHTSSHLLALTHTYSHHHTHTHTSNHSADCGYITRDGWSKIKFKTQPKYQWLIPDGVTTSVTSDCTYDRIIVEDRFMDAVVPGSAQVDRYDRLFTVRWNMFWSGGNLLGIRDISDHFPIRVQLTTRRPSRNIRHRVPPPPALPSPSQPQPQPSVPLPLPLPSKPSKPSQPAPPGTPGTPPAKPSRPTKPRKPRATPSTDGGSGSKPKQPSPTQKRQRATAATTTTTTTTTSSAKSLLNGQDFDQDDQDDGDDRFYDLEEQAAPATKALSQQSQSQQSLSLPLPRSNSVASLVTGGGIFSKGARKTAPLMAPRPPLMAPGKRSRKAWEKDDPDFDVEDEDDAEEDYE